MDFIDIPIGHVGRDSCSNEVVFRANVGGVRLTGPYAGENLYSAGFRANYIDEGTIVDVTTAKVATKD